MLFRSFVLGVQLFQLVDRAKAEPYVVYAKIVEGEGLMIGQLPLVQIRNRGTVSPAQITTVVCAVLAKRKFFASGMKIINNSYDGEIRELAEELSELLTEEFLLASDTIPALIRADAAASGARLPIKYCFDLHRINPAHVWATCLVVKTTSCVYFQAKDPTTISEEPRSTHAAILLAMHPLDLDVWNFLDMDAVKSQLGWDVDPGHLDEEMTAFRPFEATSKSDSEALLFPHNVSAPEAKAVPRTISFRDVSNVLCMSTSPIAASALSETDPIVSSPAKHADPNLGISSISSAKPSPVFGNAASAFAETSLGSSGSLLEADSISMVSPTEAVSGNGLLNAASTASLTAKRLSNMVPTKTIAPATKLVAVAPAPPIPITTHPARITCPLPSPTGAAGRQVYFFPPLPVSKIRRFSKAVPIPVKRTGSNTPHSHTSSPLTSQQQNWKQPNVGRTGVSLETIERVRLIILDKIKHRQTISQPSSHPRPPPSGRKRAVLEDPEQFGNYFGAVGIESLSSPAEFPPATKRLLLPRDQPRGVESAFPVLPFDPFLDGTPMRAERDEFLGSPTSMNSNRSQDDDWQLFNAQILPFDSIFGQPIIGNDSIDYASLPRLEDFFS